MKRREWLTVLMGAASAVLLSGKAALARDRRARFYRPYRWDGTRFYHAPLPRMSRDVIGLYRCQGRLVWTPTWEEANYSLWNEPMMVNDRRVIRYGNTWLGIAAARRSRGTPWGCTLPDLDTACTWVMEDPD